MPLFKSKVTPTRNPPKDPSQQPQHPSPLHIPEILERILSFLDERTLASTARLVCSQWRTLSKRLLPTTVQLDVCLGKKQREAIQTTIPRATRLILAATGNRALQVANGALCTLRTLLAPKCGPASSSAPDRPGSVPLQELVLGPGFSRMTCLLFLLPSSISLTRLKVHHIEHKNVMPDLGTIFQAYPYLVDLELASLAEEGFIIMEHGAPFFCKENRLETLELPSQTRLQSLCFRNLAISQSTLQNLLTASPNLKDLHLWQLRKRVGRNDLMVENDIYSTPWDFAAFLSFLLSLSLLLRAFSFTIADEEGQPVNPKHFQLEEMMQNWGGTVKAWGFSVRACILFLREPVNRITTLELIPEYRTHQGRHSYGHQLHRFLCRSPCLLHLKARDVLLNAAEMDLHGHFIRPPALFKEDKRIQVWACQGLQTLQLSFCSSLHEWQFEGIQSRIVFGYLVRFCPRLKDLEIGMVRDMGLHLEDGWAILSRLSSLERILICACPEVGPAKTMNRLWSLIRPSAVEEIQRRLTVRKWKSRLEEEEIKIQARKRGEVRSRSPQFLGGVLEDEDVSRMNLEWMDTLTDVKMALENLENQGKKKKKDLGLDALQEPCWPVLRSVEVLFQWVDAQDLIVRTIEPRKPFRMTSHSKVILVP